MEERMSTEEEQQKMLDNPGMVIVSRDHVPERWTGTEWQYHDGEQWRAFEYDDGDLEGDP